MSERGELLHRLQQEGRLGRRELFDSLSTEQKKYALQALKELRDSGKSPTIHSLWEADYKRKPVSPKEFLEDPYYLGDGVGESIYDVWKKELCYVLDPRNNIVEWILGGSIGSGKTTVSIIAQLYKIYRLSLLKNPQKFFGLAPNSRISFLLFSTILDKSQDILYEKLLAGLNSSPYFQEHFPWKRAYRSRKKREEHVDLPNSIRILPGSRASHALSEDVFGGVLDEINEKKTKVAGIQVATDIYNAIKNRITSRFGTNPPGLLCLCSSAKDRTDFIEQHLLDVENDPRVHYSRFALWEVKGYYSGKTFRVLVGDELHNSRILADHEEEPDGRQILHPPIELLPEFQRDINVALQDIAGLSTGGSNLLLSNRKALEASIDGKRKHPFTRESIYLDAEDPHIRIQDFFVPGELCERSHVGSQWSPKYYPNHARTIHVDLGLKKDAAGIAMGCSVDDQEDISVHIDFVLRVTPPPRPDGEIYITGFIDFIKYLSRNCGYTINLITYDGFQSRDSMQRLRRLGYRAELLSVDRDDRAYLALRSAVYDGRFFCYQYNPFIKEVSKLLHDATIHKVDHPSDGSKDTSDAVAGVAFNILGDKDLAHRPPAPIPDMVHDRIEEKDPRRTSWITADYKSNSGPRREIPELKKYA